MNKDNIITLEKPKTPPKMGRKKPVTIKSSRSTNAEQILFESDKPHSFWRSLTEADQHPIEKHSMKHTKVNWADCDPTGKQCKSNRLTLPLIKGSKQTPIQLRDNIIHVIQAPTKWDCDCTVVDVCEKCIEDRQTILDYLNKRTQDVMKKIVPANTAVPVKPFEFEYPETPGRSDPDLTQPPVEPPSIMYLDIKEERVPEEEVKSMRRIRKNKSMRSTLKKNKRAPEIKSRLNMEIEALLNLEAKKTLRKANSSLDRDSKGNFGEMDRQQFFEIQSLSGVDPFSSKKFSQNQSLHYHRQYSSSDGRGRLGVLSAFDPEEVPAATPSTAATGHKSHNYGYTEWDVVKFNLSRFRKASIAILEHRDVHTYLVRAVQLRKEFITDHHTQEIKSMTEELTKLLYDTVIYKLKEALSEENVEKISLKHLISLKAEVTRNLTKYDLFDTENIQFHAKKYIRSKVIVKMKEYKETKAKKEARKLLETLKDSTEYNWSDLITEVKKLNNELAKSEPTSNKDRHQLVRMSHH